MFQTPSLTRPSVPLRSCQEPSDTLRGQFLSDAGLFWLLSGDCLQLLSRDGGSCVAVWQPEVGRISAVAELCLSRRQSLLIVSVATGNQSVLVVLNPVPAHVLRAVTLPHPISSVHALSSSSLSTPGLFSQSSLSLFSGVAAVGCVGGHVYLINLCLQARDFPTASLTSPARLRPLRPAQGAVSAEVARATEEGEHCCLDLTGEGGREEEEEGQSLVY